MSSSFDYEDLVSHVQRIQKQIIEIENVLNNRQKTRKRKRDELKSRSLTFIDPLGSHISNEHMNHQLIDKILKNYKRDYVPKYLQQWTEIGIRKENESELSNYFKFKSTVSQYADGFEFISYGVVTVRVGYYDNSKSVKLTTQVLLTDTIEKLKIQIAKIGEFTNVELKLGDIEENVNPNEADWNKGIALKSDDTIHSSRLYEKDRIIMAKVEVIDHFLFTFHIS